MSVVIKQGEIADAKADVIVNAANGCGYMGGKMAQKRLCPGVAEHLNYYTHGEIEKEAKKAAHKYKWLSAWIIGRKKGEIFITSPCGLSCKEVFHAVTMRYPAGKSNIFIVSRLIENIFNTALKRNYSSIAMPLLGCGIGRLNQESVLKLIKEKATAFPQLQITVYHL